MSTAAEELLADPDLLAGGFRARAAVADHLPRVEAAALAKVAELEAALGAVLAVKHQHYLAGGPCRCVVHQDARALLAPQVTEEPAEYFSETAAGILASQATIASEAWRLTEHGYACGYCTAPPRPTWRYHSEFVVHMNTVHPGLPWEPPMLQATEAGEAG